MVWMILLALHGALIPLGLLFMISAARQWRFCEDVTRCPNCQYDLIGAESDRCSECGKTIAASLQQRCSNMKSLVIGAAATIIFIPIAVDVLVLLVILTVAS